MSQQAIKWSDVKKFFLRRNYVIEGSGGDKIIKAPKQTPTKNRTRNQVRIGHKCCSKPGDQVYDSYLSSLKRAFGVTHGDILKG